MFLETLLPPVRRSEPDHASPSARSPRAFRPSARSATPACSRRRSCPRRSCSTIPSASAPSSSRARTRCSPTRTAQRWREAREQLDLLVVIDPAMTETARARRLRPADAGRLREVGDRDLPASAIPRSTCRCGRRSCRRRRRRCPSRRSTCASPRRWASSVPCRASCTRWRSMRSSPTGAVAFLMAAQQAASRRRDAMLIFWAYRALGPHLPAPSLAAIWLLAQPERALPRRERAAHARPRLGGQDAVRDRRPSSSAASSRIPKASRSRASAPRPISRTTWRSPTARPPRARADAGGDAPRDRHAAGRGSRLPVRAGRRTAHALDRQHDPARPALAEGHAARTARSTSRPPTPPALGIKRRRRGASSPRAAAPDAAGAARREAHGRPRLDAERLRHGFPARRDGAARTRTS